MERELSELSKEWGWAKLEDCVEILDSQRIPVNSADREKRISGKQSSDLYPYYGATGQVGWIDGYLFDEELILLGEDGAPFFEPSKHKAYIIKGKTWVNNHAHVLRAITEITRNSFICNYLNFFNYNGYVTGTTRPKLNQAPMRRIPIPLPPLPEQHRIVAKIEELFTRLDAGVEALKKIKAQLKRYRQAVLKYAFEGKLTQEWREAHKEVLESASVLLEKIKEQRKKEAKEKLKELPPIDTSELPELPEGWMWTRLGLCSDLITKGESPNWQGFKYVDDGIPFIRSENVLWGSVDLTDVAKIQEEFHKKLKRSQLKDNDVLVNLVGASIGRCGIFLSDKEANINQAVALIRLNQALKSSYLVNLLLSPKMQRDIHGSKVETARPNISLGDLRYLVIALPSLSEQQKIVEEIERRLSIADNMEKVVDQNLKQSERLRQSILKRAFEGQLVPQDPTDEPAEKLLERIKTEKARREAELKENKRVKRKNQSQLELI